MVDEIVDNGIDRVLGSIASLRSEMALRFDMLDKRFDTIDKKFEGVNTRVDLIDSRVTEKFDLLDSRLKTVAVWQRIKGAASTIVGLTAIIAIWYRLADIIQIFS